MRELATGTRIREFMRQLGAAAHVDTRIYLTGGATAVLFGWRETTINVDLNRGSEPYQSGLWREVSACHWRKPIEW